MEITHIINTTSDIVAVLYTGTPDSIEKIKELNTTAREILVKPDGSLEFRFNNNPNILLEKGDYHLTNIKTGMCVRCTAEVFNDWMKITKSMSNHLVI